VVFAVPVNAIEIVRATALLELLPTGVIPTVMSLLPTEPAGGAPTVNVARPSAPVVTALVDSVTPLGASDPNVNDRR
jgi:hypothetical protein